MRAISAEFSENFCVIVADLMHNDEPIDTDIKEMIVVNGVIKPLSVTENGTYEATKGVDGYNPVIVDIPVYAGSYTVIPKTESQTLDTSNKLMQGDLIVEEIPYSEVTNLANGTTVTIG